MSVLPGAVPETGDYEEVDASFIAGFPALVANHSVNVIFGAVCSAINVVLLLILFTSVHFRGKHKIIITLGLADFSNTLAIMFMGMNRVDLYSAAYDTLTIPVRNPWICAIEPWLWLRGVGDLWGPIVQVTMGVERALAVTFPVYYRQRIDGHVMRHFVLIGSTVLFVIGSLIVGFVLAYTKRAEKAKYYCGRKAAFGDNYGTFIYLTNVLGYSIGTLLNVHSYLMATRRLKLARSSAQLERIRYQLVISFLSTILVSIPNVISLCSVWIGDVSDAISKPAVWTTCANSALNIFVYYFLNRPFRLHVHNVIKITSMGYICSEAATITRSMVSDKNSKKSIVTVSVVPPRTNNSTYRTTRR